MHSMKDQRLFLLLIINRHLVDDSDCLGVLRAIPGIWCRGKEGGGDEKRGGGVAGVAGSGAGEVV